MPENKTSEAYKLILQKTLKSRRLFLNFTYEELANKVGINKSTLQRYESGGIKNIPYDKILPLCEALGINPEYFWDVSIDYTTERPSSSADQHQADRIKLFDAHEKFEQRALKQITPKLILERFRLKRQEQGSVGDLIASKGSMKWYLDFFYTSPDDFTSFNAPSLENKLFLRLGRLAIHNKPISKYSFIVDNDKAKDFLRKRNVTHFSFDTSVIIINKEDYDEYYF